MYSEREENVKSDILHVYMALLKQTKLTSSNMSADIADEDSAMYLLQSQVCEHIYINIFFKLIFQITFIFLFMFRFLLLLKLFTLK